MIHYHGTPITPRHFIYTMAGEHFCVSFSEPRDAEVCAQIGQSVMWDSGAFTAFTQGRPVQWRNYYEWLEPRLAHPHWAVVPDVIGGEEDVQREAQRQWPFGRQLGAPVWHLNLSTEWLLELANDWPKICFGSAAEYWQVGSPVWERRVDEAFETLEKRSLRPWIHMLRGMAMAGNRWPFASADSVNVARNYKSARKNPAKMAKEIDRVQCPLRWRKPKEQMEMLCWETERQKP